MVEEVEIEEGCWVDWITSDGKIQRGQIVRIWEEKPFSEKNWWISSPNYGYSHAKLDQIIKVYPKAVIKINPSKR